MTNILSVKKIMFIALRNNIIIIIISALLELPIRCYTPP